MISIKNYLLSLGTCFGLLLIFSFFINVLNYFDIINRNAYKALIIFSIVFICFASSFILGFKSNSKGYLNGLIFGIIIILLFTIISLVFKTFSYSSFIYFLVIVISSFIGGTFGINKKTTNNQ